MYRLLELPGQEQNRYYISSNLSSPNTILCLSEESGTRSLPQEGSSASRGGPKDRNPRRNRTPRRRMPAGASVSRGGIRRRLAGSSGSGRGCELLPLESGVWGMERFAEAKEDERLMGGER